MGVLAPAVKTSHRGGRPSKLTPAIAGVIVRHIEAGAYVETACVAARVSPRTVRRWRRRGASDAPADAGYRAFRERVERAEAERELLLGSRTLRATTDSPSDARALLEMRHPDRWGAVVARPATGASAAPSTRATRRSAAAEDDAAA
jgi:hypothetical protein